MTWTKEMPANPVVAVAGATGAVGQEFLRVLHDVDFPASEVRALASARSAGKKVPFEGCGLVPAGELTVQEMTPESFEGVDIALFSAGASVSKEMREAVTAAGAVMIDNSSAFRMDEDVPLVAARNIGSLLSDGIGDAVLIQGESDPRLASFLGFNILQATGTRLTRADYVSCPSCGRTLYNIQEATARIRKATEHLKGVRIAVMGCIVNGPGEMADADFGYVGGAPNKINLYVKHTPVKFNIPQEEAVERLVDLIKEYGRWVDPK